MYLFVYYNESTSVLQRWSSAVCQRSSVTASTLRFRSTRSPKSVWGLEAEALPLFPYPGKMESVAAVGKMAKRVWAGPTAAAAPAPPSATWMTSPRCLTCLTCRWHPRRPASTAAWSCSEAEEPVPGTPPTHRLLLPLPRLCPIRIPHSRPYWMAQTVMASSSCTLTHIRFWETHVHCWTSCLMTAQ